MSKLFWICLFLLVDYCCYSQTLGGKAVYTFLQLPSSPTLAAAGGFPIAYSTDDISMATANPSLLNKNLSKQVSLGFGGFVAGIKGYSLSAAFHSDKLETTFGGHIFYLDYSTMPQTDAAGNVAGQFKPTDFVAQFSAAKQYLQRWQYGLAVKFINSSYGQYRSSAIAADIGLHYKDSGRFLSAALVIKNMGAQLSTYAGQPEELPFDLQVGIWKKLAKAPFGFSITARHLQRFAIDYNDTAFNRANGIPLSGTIEKALAHLVVAAHIYLSPAIEVTGGYNFLQRKELVVTEGNRLTGFSAGLRVKLANLQVQYSRAAYQRGVATNQLGVTLQLDKMFGLGL